jgi:hypothetical protein
VVEVGEGPRGEDLQLAPCAHGGEVGGRDPGEGPADVRGHPADAAGPELEAVLGLHVEAARDRCELPQSSLSFGRHAAIVRGEVRDAQRIDGPTRAANVAICQAAAARGLTVA